MTSADHSGFNSGTAANREKASKYAVLLTSAESNSESRRSATIALNPRISSLIVQRAPVSVGASTPRSAQKPQRFQQRFPTPFPAASTRVGSLVVRGGAA